MYAHSYTYIPPPYLHTDTLTHNYTHTYKPLNVQTTPPEGQCSLYPPSLPNSNANSNLTYVTWAVQPRSRLHAHTLGLYLWLQLIQAIKQSGQHPYYPICSVGGRQEACYRIQAGGRDGSLNIVITQQTFSKLTAAHLTLIAGQIAFIKCRKNCD